MILQIKKSLKNIVICEELNNYFLKYPLKASGVL